MPEIHIQSAKEYNADQKSEYKKYCDACKNNNLEPEPFSTFFWLAPNYGFVWVGRYPIWAATKSTLLRSAGIPVSRWKYYNVHKPAKL